MTNRRTKLMTERVQVMLPLDLLKELDSVRMSVPGIPSRSKVGKILMEEALAARRQKKP